MNFEVQGHFEHYDDDEGWTTTRHVYKKADDRLTARPIWVEMIGPYTSLEEMRLDIETQSNTLVWRKL